MSLSRILRSGRGDVIKRCRRCGSYRVMESNQNPQFRSRLAELKQAKKVRSVPAFPTISGACIDFEYRAVCCYSLGVQAPPRIRAVIRIPLPFGFVFVGMGLLLTGCVDSERIRSNLGGPAAAIE